MPPTSPTGRTFLGHPRGLATLYGTEFFERFSYYGLRALLVLFVTAAVAKGGLGLSDVTAGAVYGLYTSSAYLLCVPGGWLADRLLGQRRCVLYGGVLISLGNFTLSIPGPPLLFYLGLTVVACGTGLLKPNVSAMVGELYHSQSGTRRDAGFSLFYMGINFGATAGSIIAGGIGETLGFRWGFFTAGAAMLLGIIWYQVSGAWLGEAGLLPREANPDERRRNSRWVLVAAVALIVAVVAVSSGAVSATADDLAKWSFSFMVALAVVFFGGVLLFGKLDATAKKRVGVIVVFFLCAALFWTGYEQAGSTLNLFARDATDRSLFGQFFDAHEHPASWYQSINSILVILLSPFFAWLWVALGRRNLDPSAPLKFGFGLILLGGGFAVMLFAAKLIIANGGGRVGPQWLLMTYLLHTFGELCLSPIGLSNVTKLAPPRFVSQMMGMWFLGAALGNLLAGLIGGRIGSDVATMPAEFLRMTLIGVIAGLVMVLLSPTFRRWMGGIR
jgi:POT family proton-dependent oligopeptide transporter